MYRELAAASPDRYRPDLARSLSNLGIRFSELGRPAEALPATEEAVTMYRELAAASPDRYRPDLAASLNNLGVFFSELGRPADATAAHDEAVEEPRTTGLMTVMKPCRIRAQSHLRPMNRRRSEAFHYGSGKPLRYLTRHPPWLGSLR